MINLNELDDPFEYIYECISGIHGVELRDYLTEMYSQMVVNSGLHPDDDFEAIIELMIQNMEEDH